MLKITTYGPITQFLLTNDPNMKYPRSVACYYIDGYLIDAGQTHCKAELAKALENLPIKRIINTHSHEDHIGANRLLQDTRDLPPVWIHKNGIRDIELADVWGNAMPDYKKQAWGIPEASHAEEIPDIIDTGNYKLEVIYTPGHCKDHICLLEREHGWLFSGDLYVSKNINSVQYDENAPQIIESIEKILTYPIKTIFCAYGYVHENAREKFEEKLAILKNWQNQILELHENGVSEEDILEQLFGGEAFPGIASKGYLSRTQFIHQIIYGEPAFYPEYFEDFRLK